MGDPLGIGAEVLVKALSNPEIQARGAFVIYGLAGPMAGAAEAAGVPVFWETRPRAHAPRTRPRAGEVVLVDDSEHGDEARGVAGLAGPTGIGGSTSFRWVEDAIAATRAAGGAPAIADAIVTGPISKKAWALAGHGEFPGHTELLSDRFGATQSRMMFWSPKLRTILVTTHIPLARVAGTLSQDRVLQTIVAGHRACQRLGLARVRIAVCGVNPHAGEAGLLGDEDDRVIAPAVQRATELGIDASGPWPGDTIFHSAVEGRFDLVVAMYHDQGLIPIKLLAFHEAVNVTVGLPVIRTSPDHGTAYDIAGSNLANPGSMRAAIDLALAAAEGGV